jgi:hypothetical protein
VPAGLCNGAAGLSLAIEQRIKKIEPQENRGQDLFFSVAVGREIKHSPNCLRILILSGYRKSGASRVG